MTTPTDASAPRKTIVINLSDAGDARPLREEETFIQVDALQRVRDILRGHISRMSPVDGRCRDRCDSSSTFERHHNAIAILGGRGSGKTTFLLSLLDALGGGRERLVDKGVCVANLGVLDPTLISAKENIFLSIVSKIKSLVDKEREKCDFDTSKNKYFDRALYDLSGGISALDGIKSNLLQDGDWGDHHFVLDEGLACVRNNRLLEKRFHLFLKKSLDVLGKNFFAIGIDDIDTAFDRGWMVLETLRRYLTSPKLVVFIAGDIELFSSLVRKHQWENLGNLPASDGVDRKAYYEGVVNRLEDQYLLKILKPENRIFLKDMHHLSDPSISKFDISFNDKTIPMKDLIDDFIKKVLLVKRVDDLRIYSEAILREPIRTVIQILRCAVSVYGEQIPLNCKNLSDEVDRLLHVLTGSLSALPLRLQQVQGMTPRDIGPLVTGTLVATDRLDPGYRLGPDFADPTVNLGMIGLGAKVASLMAAKPSLAIDIMINIGGAREMQMSGPSDPSERREFMQQYLRQSGVIRGEHCLAVSCQMSAFLHHNAYGRESVHRGTIALWGSDMAGLQNDMLFSMYQGESQDGISDHIIEDNVPEDLRHYFSLVNYYRNHFDVVHNIRIQRGIYYNDISSLCDMISENEMKSISFLPYQIIHYENGGYLPIISVHNLISLVSMAFYSDDINATLVRCLRSRDYDAYRVKNKLTGNHYDDDDNHNDFSSYDFSEISKRLNKWKEHWNGLENVALLPIRCIAKIYTRFNEALKQYDRYCASISENKSINRCVYAGDALHRILIIFFNSVLVEEFRDDKNQNEHGMNLSDPIRSDEVFLRNMSQKSTDKSLFDFIWTFPLWGYYINPQSNVYKKYMENASILHVDYCQPIVKEINILGKKVVISEEHQENLFHFYNSLLLRRRPRLSLALSFISEASSDTD